MSLVECTGILPPTAMTPYSPTFRYLMKKEYVLNTMSYTQSVMFHYLLVFTKTHTILTKSPPGQVYSQIDTSRLVTYYNFRRPSSAHHQSSNQGCQIEIEKQPAFLGRGYISVRNAAFVTRLAVH
jgi:hypothetical protein